jgi:hypothetical protein
MSIGMTPDVDEQSRVVHIGSPLLVQPNTLGEPQRDQTLAQHMLHRLPEAEVHAKRKRGDQLRQPEVRAIGPVAHDERLPGVTGLGDELRLDGPISELRNLCCRSVVAMLTIEWFEGSRAALADLFAPADDSPERVASSRDLGRVLAARDGPIVIGHLELIAGERADEAEVKSIAVRDLSGVAKVLAAGRSIGHVAVAHRAGRCNALACRQT